MPSDLQHLVLTINTESLFTGITHILQMRKLRLREIERVPCSCSQQVAQWHLASGLADSQVHMPMALPPELVVYLMEGKRRSRAGSSHLLAYFSLPLEFFLFRQHLNSLDTQGLPKFTKSSSDSSEEITSSLFIMVEFHNSWATCRLGVRLT